MLVSAIMPTRGRPEMALRAVEQFQAQTWTEKELVILDDADNPSFPSGIAGDGIQYHRLRYLEIGAKRNICCSRAFGDVIAHWDDDDYSAPPRLADQIERLRESGKSVTGYSSMRFTDGRNSWMFRRHQWAIGTSLCYSREWWRSHPFPALHVGEDGRFVEMSIAEDQLVVADAGELMYATIHAGNTSPRQLTGSNWTRLEE